MVKDSWRKIAIALIDCVIELSMRLRFEWRRILYAAISWAAGPCTNGTPNSPRPPEPTGRSQRTDFTQNTYF
jgi:hypothetical protein